MTRCGWAVLLLATAAFADATESGLIVIYDNGATEPLAPYLTPFEEAAPKPAAPPAHEDRGVADLEALLPVRTPELTPGPVEPRPWPLSPAATPVRPLFLIGADEHSRHWLVRNRDRLVKSGAIGLIAQAESLADLDALADLAGGIPLLPASGTDIARIYGIRHFPVLISRHGIQQ